MARRRTQGSKVQSHLNPQKGDKAPLETMLKHVDNKEVVRSRQHEFSRGKACLINLIVFYNEKKLSGRMRGEQWTSSILKMLSTQCPHNALIDKLRKHILDE